jgi:hypothetical protein
MGTHSLWGDLSYLTLKCHPMGYGALYASLWMNQIRSPSLRASRGQKSKPLTGHLSMRGFE